jgi:hypothetical protein
MLNIYRSQRLKSRPGAHRAFWHGQSLVELALTLPVLLTILAGVVEVGNILTVYNRVQTTAREGARFGAMGGTNAGVLNIVEQASSSSLAVTDEQMKVWVIRPVVSVVGTTLSWDNTGVSPAITSTSWGGAAECVYPLAPPTGPGCGTETIPLLPTKVLGDMSAITGTGLAQLNGTRLVITVVRYDTDMILRLSFFSPPDTNGRFRTWAYSIMRQEVTQTAISLKASGCSAYPMALNLDEITANHYDTEGTIFTLEQNDEVNTPQRLQGFAFLSWNSRHLGEADITAASSGNCTGELAFPGNSVACDPLDIHETDCAFEEYGTPPLDTSMHRGDWVLSLDDHAKMSHAWSQLKSTNGHFATGRALRVIVYDYNAGPTDPNPRLYDPDGALPAYIPLWEYQIARFAIVRLIEDASCNSNMGNGTSACNGAWKNKDALGFQWVKWDESCGFDE